MGLQRKYDKLDRVRDFLLDLKATMIAERALGYGLHELLGRQGGPLAYVTCLWAGLARKDESLSLDEVTKLVQKAVKKKRTTMLEIQRFVVSQLKESGALTGYDFDDDGDSDEDEDGAGLQAVSGGNVSPLQS